MNQKINQEETNLPIQYLKGIGPKRASVLRKINIETINDLFHYYPYNYLDLTHVEPIGNLHNFVNTGKYITSIGTVKSFSTIGKFNKQRFVVIIADNTGTLQLVFFQSLQYYKNHFTVGETIAVSGKVTDFMNKPQMAHPMIDRITAKTTDGELEGFLHTKGIIPQYRITEELRSVGLESRNLRRIMKNAIEKYINAVQDFIPAKIVNENKLLELREAIKGIHFPSSHENLEQARRRLKFNEFFSMQLLLALRRKKVKAELSGIQFQIESKLARSLVDSLPFKLTKSQIHVINEITEDMKKSKPMNRLLQGDVGSGKTIVALLIILVAIENGYQAALMAPTEILAEQHYQTMHEFLHSLPVKICLLVSGQPKRLRKDTLNDIQKGSAQIVVGTHALIQESVEFANLGLVIIDEQHRFGVYQRMALKQKAFSSNKRLLHPDVLVMTATPIPRSLALTLYGDLDVSIIRELPAGRKPIKTLIKTESQRNELYSFIHTEIQKGRQAYIVYPIIEESEKLDLRAATKSYELIKNKIFPDLKIGLMHGRMSIEEKDMIMSSFKNREFDILVSTTVIEVGINIPNATLIVIEHAERFGLSQLHQLRGRVGRGTEQSYCIMIVPDWVGNIIKRSKLSKSEKLYNELVSDIMALNGEEAEYQKVIKRVIAMLEISDGFKIAEIDLNLRGPGDFFGPRQSGLPELQLANLVTDADLLTLARKESFALVDIDPHLRMIEHQQLRKHFKSSMKESLELIEVG